MANTIDMTDNPIVVGRGSFPTAPSSYITPKVVSEVYDNPYRRNTLGMALSTLAMGIGEGMTGRPFLTNFANNMYEQKQAQLKYKQWQQEQQIKAQEDAMQNQLRQSQIDINKEVMKSLSSGGGDKTKEGGTEFAPEDYINKQVVRNVRGIPQIMTIPELKPTLPPTMEKSYRGILNTELAIKQNLKMLQDDKTLEKYMSPLEIKAWKGGNPIGALGNLLIKMNPKDANWSTFKAETDKAFQTFRKETTGAQAALAELGWLAPDYPEADDNPTQYKRKAAVALQRMAEAKEMLKNSWGANYRVSNLTQQKEAKTELDMTDPRVKKALDAGYKPEEINAFLNKGKQNAQAVIR